MKTGYKLWWLRPIDQVKDVIGIYDTMADALEQQAHYHWLPLQIKECKFIDAPEICLLKSLHKKTNVLCDESSQ